MKEVKRYLSEDGELFDDKEKCISHENNVFDKSFIDSIGKHIFDNFYMCLDDNPSNFLKLLLNNETVRSIVLSLCEHGLYKTFLEMHKSEHFGTKFDKEIIKIAERKANETK